jgi:hypothetical protein
MQPAFDSRRDEWKPVPCGPDKVKDEVAIDGWHFFALLSSTTGEIADSDKNGQKIENLFLNSPKIPYFPGR